MINPSKNFLCRFITAVEEMSKEAGVEPESPVVPVEVKASRMAADMGLPAWVFDGPPVEQVPEPLTEPQRLQAFPPTTCTIGDRFKVTTGPITEQDRAEKRMRFSVEMVVPIATENP